MTQRKSTITLSNAPAPKPERVPLSSIPSSSAFTGVIHYSSRRSDFRGHSDPGLFVVSAGRVTSLLNRGHYLQVDNSYDQWVENYQPVDLEIKAVPHVQA